jgi:asparagine synthase (glutamine-hydrolysing)
VPPALVERPKAGFSVPIGAWLRGPLREWAGDLLSEPAMRRQGYLDPAPVQAAFRDHVAGHQDRTEQLWNVLMFQAWLASQRG